LPGLKGLGRVGISGVDVGVGFLGNFAPGFFGIFEGGITVEAQNIKGMHLVASPAAVAGPCPAIMGGFLIA